MTVSVFTLCFLAGSGRRESVYTGCGRVANSLFSNAAAGHRLNQAARHMTGILAQKPGGGAKKFRIIIKINKL
jgi:hypothetical protein